MLRYKTKTRPGLVALYDIRPGNGAGPFLQPPEPARTHKRTQTISHKNAKRKNYTVMDHTLLQKYRIYSSKNNFRLWILAEVEQLFC